MPFAVKQMKDTVYIDSSRKNFVNHCAPLDTINSGVGTVLF